MKQNILTIAKSAMKFFFDIDPVITEHMMLQAASQTVLIQHELSTVWKLNVQQRRLIQLLRPEATQQLNAA